MMDLSKPLPCEIYVNGNGFFINTDFRIWLRFGRLLKVTGSNPMFGDMLFLFREDVKIEQHLLPKLLMACIEFYVNKNDIPKDMGGGNGARLYDFDMDSEFIYAAFMQQYHVNLFTANIHWHEFLALFRCLSDDTMMSKIMGYRGYHKDNRTQEHAMQQLQYMWALPIEYTEEEEEAIDAFNNYFT